MAEQKDWHGRSTRICSRGGPGRNDVGAAVVWLGRKHGGVLGLMEMATHVDISDAGKGIWDAGRGLGRLATPANWNERPAWERWVDAGESLISMEAQPWIRDAVEARDWVCRRNAGNVDGGLGARRRQRCTRAWLG